MNPNTIDLIFETREDFRKWLRENATTSEGVWLIFGKTKAIKTLSAKDALEEALCFGWIDGQINGIDDTKYRKYFTCRRKNSPWSGKNKGIVEILRKNSLMTDLGEQAIKIAKQNGMWDASPSGSLTEEQIAVFETKLSAFLTAYENYTKMPKSAKTAYIRRYSSYKKEEIRQKNFVKIVDALIKNLKPTI